MMLRQAKTGTVEVENYTHVRVSEVVNPEDEAPIRLSSATVDICLSSHLLSVTSDIPYFFRLLGAVDLGRLARRLISFTGK